MILEQAKQRRKHLINYLYDKVQLKDWHGVSDAANDLRVLEATCPDLLMGDLAIEMIRNETPVEQVEIEGLQS